MRFLCCLPLCSVLNAAELQRCAPTSDRNRNRSVVYLLQKSSDCRSCDAVEPVEVNTETRVKPARLPCWTWWSLVVSASHLQQTELLLSASLFKLRSTDGPYCFRLCVDVGDVQTRDTLVSLCLRRFNQSNDSELVLLNSMLTVNTNHRRGSRRYVYLF